MSSFEVSTVSSRKVFLASFSFCLSVFLAGCSLSNMNAPSTSTTTTMIPHIAGMVHGGQQPISGATIQLYATNPTTDKGASTALISGTVTTASDGSFSITGDYTCPTSNPLVYLLATGGNPGLGGSVNNTDIALMAVLGTCSTLTSSTFVAINELTTMLGVQALAPFMTDGTHIGESPTNPVAIAGAMREVSGLNTLGTGNFPGNGLSYEPLELQFNMLADVLAACVNTAGGVSGDGSACGKLLQATGGTDTVTAALEMANTPTKNAQALYNLIVAGAPFQPYFSSLPSDLAVTVGYPLPWDIWTVQTVTGTLDSNGHIWLYFGGYTYTPLPIGGTGTDTSTDVQGTIIVYDNNFNQLFTISTGTGGTAGPGGLYYPSKFSADASGHVFVTNSNNTISEFGSTGTAISPAGGWSTGVTPTFSASGSGNTYQTNTSQVGRVNVDALGNMWATIPNFSGPCYVELNSSGTVITPSNTTAFCNAMRGSLFASITDMAPDGSGNAWAFSDAAIAEVNSTGGLAATAATTTGCMNPTSAFTATATSHILYDHVKNQLWAYSDVGAGAITDSNSNVFCNNGPPSMPLVLPFSIATGVGNPYSSGSVTIQTGTLDGAGNLWFISNGVAASGTETSTSGAFNGTATFSTWLGAIGPSGAIQTPYNGTTLTYGDQATGFGVNASASLSGQGVYTAGLVGTETGVLGIDSSGNIWVLDEESFRVIKISGLATANTVNY